jgi:predicted transcriptional regulator of viral defense system
MWMPTLQKGVICLLSAETYYQLTTFIPDAVDVAIPRKARVCTIPDWPQMRVYYYADERHGLGATKAHEGKNGFLSMNVEKTVVDIVFY